MFCQSITGPPGSDRGAYYEYLSTEYEYLKKKVVKFPWEISVLWGLYQNRDQLHMTACHMTNKNCHQNKAVSGVSASISPQWINFITTWISNRMSDKMWDEITYPFQTSTVAPLKFENG